MLLTQKSLKMYGPTTASSRTSPPRAQPGEDRAAQRVEHPVAAGAKAEARGGAADDAPQPCERRPDEEGDRKDELDVDPERGHHPPVVHAGANDHPGPGL